MLTIITGHVLPDWLASVGIVNPLDNIYTTPSVFKNWRV